MFDVSEKIMQVKGAVIDLNRWQRDRLVKKIEKQQDKLNRKNEHINCLVEKWLDDWSDVLNKDGYRTKDGELINIKELILNQR